MAQLTGTPVVFASGGTSETYTTPFPHQLGTRAFDLAQNEYIFCQFGNAFFATQLAMISHDGTYTATNYAVGAHGPVGVIIAESSPTSDMGGWLQIGGYGYVMAAIGSSLATSSGRALVATSLSTPATALLAVSTGTSVNSDVIQKMWLTQLTSTGVAGGASHTGLRQRVWMDHPYIMPPDATS